MLQKLSIKNVALLSRAEIELTGGLNVLSGETGAGKSIVVDCLMLLFSRYDKAMLRFGATDGFVEGVFSLSATAAATLADMGFECDDLAIIRRRFSADGKSDARINGQPATVGMLKRAGQALIDIYGQHDFQQLGSLATQLSILDYFDRKNQQEIKAEIAEKYAKFCEIKRQIADLGEGKEREKEIDFLRFQLDEIEASGSYQGEEDEILLARKRALNTEKIASALTETVELTAVEQLGRAAQILSKITDFDPDFAEIVDRISSAAIEIDDINAVLSEKLGELDADQTDLDKLEQRLAVLRNLSRKYGDFDKMTAYSNAARERLFTLENCEKTIGELAKKRQKLLTELYDLSSRLSDKRRTAADKFCAHIVTELRQLGMENAEFSIKFSDAPPPPNKSEIWDELQKTIEKRLSKIGFDEIEFYFCANAGQPQMPLLKVISGGEMSRFMLALKAVSGSIDMIPTLIFDEIDTGISGRVGREVAKKLAGIAATTQVLCVTHLPQIAAMSDNHLYVSKKTTGGETETHIERLDESGMIAEITRLSGGEGISESAGQAAAEIRDWCKKFKSETAKTLSEKQPK